MADKLVRFFILLAFLLGLIYSHDTVYSVISQVQLSSVDLVGWFFVLFLNCAMFLVLPWLFWVSMKVVDADISLPISFLYSGINSFMNQFLPFKGGLFLRGYLLKTKHQVSWRKYFFVVFSGQLLGIFLLLFFGLATLFDDVVELVSKFFSAYEFSSYKLFSFACLLLLLVLVPKGRALLQKLALAFKSGVLLWSGRPALLLHYLLVMGAFHIFSAMRLWFSFYLLGESLSFVDLWFLYLIISISSLWMITPGNIGVRETLVVLLSGGIGIPSAIAISASVIERISSLLTIGLIGGGCNLWYVARNPDSDKQATM